MSNSSAGIEISARPREEATIMNRYLPVTLLSACLGLIALPASAQTFTMNKNCRAHVAAAQDANAAEDFAAALTAFDLLIDECKTRDAKELIQVGRAHAFNGLRQYDSAISAADAALEVTKNKSLDAYFERAYAREEMGEVDGAQADYDQIIALTEKNKNVNERATLYSKVADMNYRTGRKAEADQYMAKAMELDPANPDFHLQRGDWASAEGDYAAAFAEYDRAAEIAPSDPDVYLARSESRLKMVQEKYGTSEASALRKSMTPEEKNMVCTEMKKAIDLGLRNMQFDMFSALVCR
jgi:tetratricopeptide (TPR) repeat protein